MKWKIQFTTAALVILFALAFFIYPAVTLGLVLLDGNVRTTGQSRLVAHWFKGTAQRYDRWARQFLAERTAAQVSPEHVAATEWPMFGSVFLLLTAEELQTQGALDPTRGPVRAAVESAKNIVIAPETASWVRAKWGDDYLEQENVFYRMLLIMGLSSYEHITGNTEHRTLMSQQRQALADELMRAPYPLRDDYPGECYPVDVLWSVAAIQRAARLEGTQHDELAKKLIAALDGPIKTAQDLPAYQIDAPTGHRLQEARGCGNSGLLLFAPELDAPTARRWYDAYEKHFWKNNGWIAGFTELPRGTRTDFMDVDSGPVLFELGSVASAFGIGAAKRAGRLAHAAPLTWEAVACSWPTPLGFLIPGAMGQLAVGSWSLGEVALLFSMTRPLPAGAVDPTAASVPGSVWILLALYAGLGLWFIASEVRVLRREFRRATDQGQR